MELYGSILPKGRSHGRWFLELPSIWCRNKIYLNKYPEIFDNTFNSIEKKNQKLNFYKMLLHNIEFKSVLDLRKNNWKDALCTISTLSSGRWESRGGLWSSVSPLDHITYKGNCNLLNYFGYRWVIINHTIDLNIDPFELWCYIDMKKSPSNFYEVVKINSAEVLE